MFGDMSKSKEKFIPCPRTKKRLSVSRDVWNALMHYAEEAKKEQAKIESSTQEAYKEIQNVSEILAGKLYKAESEILDTVLTVSADNQIAHTEIKFTGELDNICDESVAVITKVIADYTHAVNKVLEARKTEIETELKAKLKNVA
jgi:signal transduction protein with GAF and PtsI domain